MDITIFYSTEDNGFIAYDSTRPGLSAFGGTMEETEKEFRIAEKLWEEEEDEKEFYQHVSAVENKIRDSLEQSTGF